MLAAIGGHVPMVELLLRIKADINGVDVRSRFIRRLFILF